MKTLIPFVAMVLAIIAQSSNLVVSKRAMSEGTNKYIILVYSNILSALMLLLFYFFFHRSDGSPITVSLLWKLLLLLLLGSAQVLGYVGIDYSSPTMSTALLNIIPAITFLLAVFFRMENLKWKSSSTQAKILGTFVSISGAFVVTFFKGPPIINPNSSGISSHLLQLSPKLSWTLGGFFLAVDALLSSVWYIMQAMILKNHSELVLLTFYFSFLAIISALFTLVMVEDPNAWKIRFDMGLVAILYAALIGMTFRFSLTVWVNRRCGPLYVTLFKPFGIIVAVVMGVLFLGEALCLGSLIGAVIIASGFYGVMWGKAKEQKSVEDDTPSTAGSCNQKVPLLQNKTESV